MDRVNAITIARTAWLLAGLLVVTSCKRTSSATRNDLLTHVNALEFESVGGSRLGTPFPKVNKNTRACFQNAI